MSDPVTNVEIEDVLSSIRKLVSEGEQSRVRDMAPSQPTPDPVSAEPERSESKPEKLLLTPDHMIAAAPEKDTKETLEAPLQLTQIVWEPEDEPANDQAERDETPEVEETIAEQEVPPEPEGEAEFDEPVLSRSDLEATIAELEASVGGDFEPDGSEEAEVVAAVPWPGSRRHGSDPEFVEDADEADNQSDAEAPEESLDAALASDDEIEEFLTDPAALDEEMLRELVAEIVREELQGSLGERITRNVRKLVRREIYRILSSQEFD